MRKTLMAWARKATGQTASSALSSKSSSHTSPSASRVPDRPVHTAPVLDSTGVPVLFGRQYILKDTTHSQYACIFPMRPFGTSFIAFAPETVRSSPLHIEFTGGAPGTPVPAGRDVHIKVVEVDACISWQDLHTYWADSPPRFEESAPFLVQASDPAGARIADYTHARPQWVTARRYLPAPLLFLQHTSKQTDGDRFQFIPDRLTRTLR